LVPVVEGLLPIDSPPVGVVTWYTPSGAVGALTTSWLGVVNGHPPELHAGCCMQLRGSPPFAPGTDFAVNIPASLDRQILSKLPQWSLPGCTLELGAETELLSAHVIRAPLLAGCTLQIECSGGRALPGDWVPQLAGNILLLHRGGRCLDPTSCRDFSALHPLHAEPPA
jgi:hypothetical protein